MGVAQQVLDPFPPNTNQGFVMGVPPQQILYPFPSNTNQGGVYIMGVPLQQILNPFPSNNNQDGTSITMGARLVSPTDSQARERPITTSTTRNNRPNNTQRTFSIAEHLPDPRGRPITTQNTSSIPENVPDPPRRSLGVRAMLNRLFSDTNPNAQAPDHEELMRRAQSYVSFPTPGERFMNAGIDSPVPLLYRNFSHDALSIIQASLGRSPQLIERQMRDLYHPSVEMFVELRHNRSQRYEESMFQRLRWDLIRIQAGTATDISADVRAWLELRLSEESWLERWLSGLGR
jgi:hypothetical protein